MNNLTLSAQEYYNFILDKRKKEWKKHFSYSKSEKEYSIPYSPKTRKPIKIPKDWTWMTIDQIALKMNAGSTPRGGKKIYQKSGILFIRSQNVRMGRLETKDIAYISEEIHHKMEGSKVNYGNILLNITGASIGRIAWYNLKNYEANVNQHVSVIRLVEEIPDWIVLFFSTRWGQKQILDYQSGSTRQGLNINNQKQLMFPLAPLREQLKIVLIFNNLNKTIVNTEKTIELLRILKKGLMQHLFMEGIGHTEFKETSLGKIPKEWEIVQFNDSIIKHKNKINSLKTNEYQLTGNFPIIDQGKDFISGYSDRADLSYNGDLPVVIFGDHTRIFKFIDLRFICGADGTKVLIPNKSLFDPLYLYYAYSNFRIKNLGYSRHYKLLKEFRILKPQLEEQKRISFILGNIDNQILAENKIKGGLKLIKKGLMQDLLTGKKRVIIN